MHISTYEVYLRNTTLKLISFTTCCVFLIFLMLYAQEKSNFTFYRDIVQRDRNGWNLAQKQYGLNK